MEIKNQILFLYKTMPKEYIPSLSEGNVYFSCCSKWISIAKAGGGKGQGDKHEGVFAKYLKKNSRKPIQHYKKIFGKDLIVQTEGDYKLLSRKSSLHTPAVCFYSIDMETVKEYMPEKEQERIETIAKATNDNTFHVNDLPIKIPDKYFSEFNIDSNDIDALAIQPRKFLNKLTEMGAIYRKITYIDTSKEYDIFENSSVDLETAIEQHLDIFYKDKSDYEHQCEFRIILPNQELSSINKGINVHLNGLSRHICGVDPHGLTLDSNTDFICNVKNLEFFVGITFEKLNDD